MNIKITEQHRNWLVKNSESIDRHLFGSQLIGNNHGGSDVDLMVIYNLPNDYYRYMNIYPNMHLLQYDEPGHNEIWATHNQFFRGLFYGEGIIQIDIVLFNENFIYKNDIKDPVKLLRTKNTLKCLLGVAKRDLINKKTFFANKGYYMAKCIFENKYPDLDVIVKNEYNVTNEDISGLRKEVMKAHEKNEIQNFFIPDNVSKYERVIIESNNIKEFRYI